MFLTFCVQFKIIVCFYSFFLLVSQEIMVGSNYQAEIPALSCYNDEDKGELMYSNGINCRY